MGDDAIMIAVSIDNSFSRQAAEQRASQHALTAPRS
jgi:hypothetical protein